MYKNITISDFYQASLEEKITIIDVREGNEFDYGHVPGAVNLPLSEFENYQKIPPTISFVKQAFGLFKPASFWMLKGMM